MSASTVRISDTARQALRDLAQRDHVPMQTVLDRAIENYRRKRFLDAANQTYADLRADLMASQAEAEEREDWEATIGDGIDAD